MFLLSKEDFMLLLSTHLRFLLHKALYNQMKK